MDGNTREPSADARSNDPKQNFDSKEVFFDIPRTLDIFRDQDSELNLESIVSAPVVAVSKANSTMLSGQLQFLLDYCFNRTDAENQSYTPRMINLVVTRGDQSGSEENFEQVTIAVPVITLLPINSLGIDKMDISFTMEITSISSYKNSNGNRPDRALERKAQLLGKIGSKEKGKPTSEKSDPAYNNDKNLSVRLEASKLPLPLGILNVIDMLNKYTTSQI
jgi:hypothetical protein